MWCEITLRPILPVHAEAVAALDAFHIFGLSRYVLTLVTAGAHEMGLEHEDCRLRGDQILRSFERDLDGGLAEEQRVVPDSRLHRQILDVGAADLPGLVVHARGLGHRRARPGRHDPAALHLAALDCGRGEVETDVGALLALFGCDEHTVADDDRALGGLVRHGLQYTPSRPRRPRPRPKW